MDWTERVLSHLAAATRWGYHHDGPSASEPAALAAMALAAHGRASDAQRPLAWLIGLQSREGCVGVTADQATPGWPTCLAVLAWKQAADNGATQYAPNIRRAIEWILSIHGEVQPPTDQLGHDGTIVGWPWVIGTHSWVEPTALALLALRAVGLEDHPRARDAERLLIDRLLPTGGANYGNTLVLGQMLRAHLQSTGLCLTALSGTQSQDPRIEYSLAYLRRELDASTSTASLCYALIGLTAHGECDPAAHDWLAAAADRTLTRDPAPHKLALLLLAALDAEHLPLVAKIGAPT